MNEKERGAVKMLLMMNAIQFLVFDCLPQNDRLEISAANITQIGTAMRMALNGDNPSVTCAMALAGYYTDSITVGSPIAMASTDYPDLYAQLEKKFLSNSCMLNFLSVVADAYKDDGEPTIYNRLVAKNAYVASGAGKDFARSGLTITPKKRGFWASLFG